MRQIREMFDVAASDGKTKNTTATTLTSSAASTEIWTSQSQQEIYAMTNIATEGTLVASATTSTLNVVNSDAMMTNITTEGTLVASSTTSTLNVVNSYAMTNITTEGTFVASSTTSILNMVNSYAMTNLTTEGISSSTSTLNEVKSETLGTFESPPEEFFNLSHLCNTASADKDRCPQELPCCSRDHCGVSRAMCQCEKCHVHLEGKDLEAYHAAIQRKQTPGHRLFTFR